MDALRGGFGTVGSIIRARSMRKSIISGTGPSSPAVEEWRARHPYASGTEESGGNVFMPGMQRHQLYDAPVPRSSIVSNTTGGGGSDDISLRSQPRRGHKSIKFGAEDTRHFYPSPGLPGTAHHDSVKKEEAGYPSATDAIFSSQQMKSPVQSRPLPKANDPFEDPRFRTDTAGSTDDEEAEEVPLTASLHKSYPPSGDTAEDQEERSGLVGGSSDSVRLVSSRR
jgi:magnesium transporter